MTTAARMGRPPVLTRDQIARTVIAIGFTDLTVAAVRDRLGVGQTTLYRYIADRDELVRLGLSHLLEYAAWPALDGPWRTVLSDYAFTLWQLWAAHPGAATEAARGVLSLATLPLVDDLGTMLLRHDFSPANAMLTCDIVFDLVTDNRRNLEHLHADDPRSHAAHTGVHAGRYPNQARSEAFGPVSEDERQIVRTALNRATATDPLDWFTQKLDVVLDGVEHSLAP